MIRDHTSFTGSNKRAVLGFLRKCELARAILVEHGGSMHPRDLVAEMTLRHGLRSSWVSWGDLSAAASRGSLKDTGIRYVYGSSKTGQSPRVEVRS